MRDFSRWAGEQIEKVCRRNDVPRPGKGLKGPWEIDPPHVIRDDIEEEYGEVFNAFIAFDYDPSEINRGKLQWELADLAATAMMLSARIDPLMSTLRRGRK